MLKTKVKIILKQSQTNNQTINLFFFLDSSPRILVISDLCILVIVARLTKLLKQTVGRRRRVNVRNNFQQIGYLSGAAVGP